MIDRKFAERTSREKKMIAARPTLVRQSSLRFHAPHWFRSWLTTPIRN